jgi:peptidoglycan/LPS O-acetylase OafA/YrhL
MKLSEILNKDSNNIDIFRVIAACMVIYGHAYALAPELGQSDFIGRHLGFDYSGSLAVKIFFFLSGLVLTNSLLLKRDPTSFIVSRFFRIWPAFTFVIIASAFLIGPIMTTYTINEYFNNILTYDYILKNLFMHINFELPGVFTNNTYGNAINGSIWTLPYEIAAYIVLLSLFMIGIFTNKKIATFIFILILLDPLLGNKIALTWLPQVSEITLLAPCFAFGSILAIYKNEIEINITVLIGVWLLYYSFNASTYSFYFFYLALFISILFISSLSWVIKMRPKADISYGIYLWGWPVQQIISILYKEQGVVFNQSSSILISILLGFISWYLIEKRSMAYGVIVQKRLGNLVVK